MNTPQNEDKSHNISTSTYIIFSVLAILVICICIISHRANLKEKEEDSKINLSAYACSIHNYTNALITNIENSSSMEWYVDYAINEQKRSEQEALQTYSDACMNYSFNKDLGIDHKDITLIEYTGDQPDIQSAYDNYAQMYKIYNELYSLIENPYLPADKYIDEVYEKSNAIFNLYQAIQTNLHSSDIEADYASQQTSYYVYYINK